MRHVSDVTQAVQSRSWLCACYVVLTGTAMLRVMMKISATGGQYVDYIILFTWP